MFYLIQKALKKALSLNELSDRVQILETKLQELEHLADENSALWQRLDEEREMEGVFVGSAEEFEKEISEMMLRNAIVQGDAQVSGFNKRQRTIYIDEKASQII